MSLGKTIKERREELHMTQEELAERLNVSRQAVSKWESDISVPAQGNLQELCKLLDLTLPAEMEPVGLSPHKTPYKLLWITCVMGWAAACVLGIILGVQAWRNAARAAAQGVSDVSFYDGEGRVINCEANWYELDTSTTVVITYEGASPDATTLYLTPAGSEMLSERKQLVVLPGDDAQKGYVLIHLTFAESLMGHLQVALDYGSTSIFSDLYNVFLE